MKPLVKELVAEAKSRMVEANKAEHLVDVDWLMMSVLELERPIYLMAQDQSISDKEAESFFAFMERRLQGEPLQYILGHQFFYGYDFYVDHRVLIPRFETEELVEKVIKVIDNNNYTKVMDLCCGSGCIGLTLLLECKEIKVTLVDISIDALAVAQHNAEALEVRNRSTFVLSDLYEAVKMDLYDVIVSNPPYIETAVIDTLEEEVKIKEPDLALDGGSDGLEFYRRIISDSRVMLKKGGFLFLEIGYNQMAAVQSMMNELGYSKVQGYKDLSGQDRMIVGRWL